jgi:hypothetical protein
VLTMHDLHERAYLAQEEVNAAAEHAMYIRGVREELDLPPDSLRSLLARALVRLGVRLDPEVVESLAAEKQAA